MEMENAENIEKKEQSARGSLAHIKLPSIHDLAKLKEMEEKDEKIHDDFKIELLKEKKEPKKVKLEIYNLEKRKSNFFPTLIVFLIIAGIFFVGFLLYDPVLEKIGISGKINGKANSNFVEQTNDNNFEKEKIKQVLIEGIN